MAKSRKIKCDCGSYLTEQSTLLSGIATKAMVCPNCHFTTLTKKQAEAYVRLKQLHDIIDADRKIIKIGNSMGLTLPDKLTEFGAQIGRKVKTEALTPHSFKVEFIDNKQ